MTPWLLLFAQRIPCSRNLMFWFGFSVYFIWRNFFYMNTICRYLEQPTSHCWVQASYRIRKFQHWSPRLLTGGSRFQIPKFKTQFSSICFSLLLVRVVRNKLTFTEKKYLLQKNEILLWLVDDYFVWDFDDNNFLWRILMKV